VNRLLALAWLVTGCTAPNLVLPPPAGSEVTIFVPGYKGSFLVTGDHQRAWVTPGAALSRGDRALAAPFPGQRPLDTFGALAPDGPMTRLTVIPAIFQQEVYLKWMEFGRDRLPGFVAFSYDWRQDLRKSAGELCALVDSLTASGEVKVNLVAHSMGGLVSLYCLRYGTGPATSPPSWAGAARVRRVVFVGTPFSGSPGMFDDFFLGTPTGRNRALLSPEALFSFTASFQILPHRSDFFVDSQDQAVALDAYDPKTWWTRGWGVFADAALRDDAAYRAQLERQLAARAEFAAAMSDVEGAPPGFRALMVVGRGRPVVSAMRVAGDGFDFDHPAHADGDGTVLASRAVPPRPMTLTTQESGAEHTELMRDPAVDEAIAAFLERP
jgi:pimeloyl-ACP methyl ester carboxylesterase